MMINNRLNPFSGKSASWWIVHLPLKLPILSHILYWKIGFFTANQLKAQKSLEANNYNQFVGSWVRKVCNQKICVKFVSTTQISLCITIKLYNCNYRLVLW